MLTTCSMESLRPTGRELDGSLKSLTAKEAAATAETAAKQWSNPRATIVIDELFVVSRLFSTAVRDGDVESNGKVLSCCWEVIRFLSY